MRRDEHYLEEGDGNESSKGVGREEGLREDVGRFTYRVRDIKKKALSVEEVYDRATLRRRHRKSTPAT